MERQREWIAKLGNGRYEAGKGENGVYVDKEQNKEELMMIETDSNSRWSENCSLNPPFLLHIYMRVAVTFLHRQRWMVSKQVRHFSQAPTKGGRKEERNGKEQDEKEEVMRCTCREGNRIFSSSLIHFRNSMIRCIRTHFCNRKWVDGIEWVTGVRKYAASRRKRLNEWIETQRDRRMESETGRWNYLWSRTCHVSHPLHSY